MSDIRQSEEFKVAKAEYEAASAEVSALSPEMDAAVLAGCIPADLMGRYKAAFERFTAKDLALILLLSQ